ncbi:MAG TPA: transglutaminase domain-containing protein [Tissierellia bacterium]|jgi:hypothetical protein|nr:transglutaminase domain-containing protein [Tissierellia bacterium]
MKNKILSLLVSMTGAFGFSLVLYYFFLLPYDYSFPLPWVFHLLLLAGLLFVQKTWKIGRWVFLAVLLLASLMLLHQGFRAYALEIILKGEEIFQQIYRWSVYPSGNPPAFFLRSWSVISVFVSFVFYHLFPAPFAALTFLALPLFLNFSIDAKEWTGMLFAGFVILIPLFGVQKARRQRAWSFSPLLLLVVLGVFLGLQIWTSEDLFSTKISDFFNEDRQTVKISPLGDFSLSTFGLYEGDAQLSGKPVQDNTPYLSISSTDFPTYLGIRKYEHFDSVRARWFSEVQEEIPFDEINEEFPLARVFPTPDEELAEHVTLTYQFLLRGPSQLFHGGAPREITSTGEDHFAYTPSGEVFRSGSDLETAYSVTGWYWNKESLDEKMEELSDIPSVLEESISERLDLLAQGRTGVEALLFFRDYFASHFTYNESSRYPMSERDFIGWFLHNQEGFCVHFATAMTMIASEYGFPSRYVEGFVLPTDRTILGTYEAHAWSEIYLVDIGWVPFDATPASYQEILFTRGAVEETVYPQDSWEEEVLPEPKLPEQMPQDDAPIDLAEPSEMDAEEKRVESSWKPGTLLLLLALLYLLSRWIVHQLRHHRRWLSFQRKKDSRKLVRKVLKEMHRLLQLAGVPPQKPWNVSSWMHTKLYPHLRTSTDIFQPSLRAIERSLYGEEDASIEEVDALLSYYQRLEIKTRRETPLWKWFFLRFFLPGFFVDRLL